MDAGCVLFHKGQEVWDDTLAGIGINEKDLHIDPDKFKKFHGLDLQSIFILFYEHPEMWSFLCREVKKRNGSLAYKVMDKNNKIKEIPQDDVYFALKIEDYNFRRWALMKGEKRILTSEHNTPVVKVPSKGSKKTLIKGDFLFPSKSTTAGKMLYQIVRCPSQSVKHPYYEAFNTEWEKHKTWENKWTDTKDLAYLQSMMSKFDGSKPCEHYAIQFSHNNIQPNRFSIAKQCRSYQDDLFICFNFSQGFPLKGVKASL